MTVMSIQLMKIKHTVLKKNKFCNCIRFTNTILKDSVSFSSDNEGKGTLRFSFFSPIICITFLYIPLDPV